MSQGSVKDMRKQLRNVVQESLNEVLLKELKHELMKHIDQRLDAIMKHLGTVLDTIDQRSKDVSSSVLRAIPPLLPGVRPSDLNT